MDVPQNQILEISIHALLAESDMCHTVDRVRACISIHALLAESDVVSLLMRMALISYFYPRSPCGERPAIDVFLAVWAVISIHALLAESDRKSDDRC